MIAPSTKRTKSEFTPPAPNGRLSGSGAADILPSISGRRIRMPYPGPQTNRPTADAAETFAGLIERVTFFNEENGFAVLKVKAKGHRDLVPVVGSVPSVSAGEWVEARGHWIQDRQFGRQFRADSLRCTPPTTQEGIQKYLGSGMVKGIGPVYATKLVERFGKEVLDVIETRSARLQEVDGIGVENPLEHDPVDGGLDEHQHFKCVECKRVIDFSHEPFNNIEVPQEMEEMFVVLRKSVYLEGICDLCR